MTVMPHKWLMDLKTTENVSNVDAEYTAIGLPVIKAYRVQSAGYVDREKGRLVVVAILPASHHVHAELPKVDVYAPTAQDVQTVVC